MNKEEEIELIKKVLSHPAGISLDIFGLISIRSHSDGYEVAWGKHYEMDTNTGPYKDFIDLHEAVEFFVNKRYELELGLDIELELMKKNGS